MKNEYENDKKQKTKNKTQKTKGVNSPKFFFILSNKGIYLIYLIIRHNYMLHYYDKVSKCLMNLNAQYVEHDQ